MPDDHDGRWRWSYLFRSWRSRREGTMPAGLVIVVVVIGLLVAALLNADATLRKSKANGDGFRQDVAAAVAGVSDAIGLSGGRNRLDEALGRETGPAVDVEDLLNQQQGELASAEGPTTTIPPKPVLRTPTPDNPLRLWVGGDSVGGSFGVQMEPVSASTGLFKPTLDYTVGTGLTRPEFYNWPEHFAKDVIPNQDPDIIMPMFGANDDQNMELQDGTILTKYTPEWFEEYRRRVGATMDLMKSPDNDRLVAWVGSVPAGPGSKISNQDTLNYIYWSEAQKRPWVTYIDTWALIGGPRTGPCLCRRSRGCRRQVARHVPEGQPASRDHRCIAIVMGGDQTPGTVRRHGGDQGAYASTVRGPTTRPARTHRATETRQRPLGQRLRDGWR